MVMLDNLRSHDGLSLVSDEDDDARWAARERAQSVRDRVQEILQYSLDDIPTDSRPLEARYESFKQRVLATIDFQDEDMESEDSVAEPVDQSIIDAQLRALQSLETPDDDD